MFHFKPVLANTEFGNGYLQLHISDNGRGFEYNAAQDVQGSGLRNMHSRSKLTGALMYMNSTPENGTQIHLDLPLTN